MSMKRKLNNSLLIEPRSDYEDDLDALLHPAQAFEHPSDVVNDPDLTLNEKRAILASWASDACAIEAAPTLRCVPGTKLSIRFDDVMDALRALDRQAREQTNHRARYHRIPRRPKRPAPKRNDPDEGQQHSIS
jgi:hypothetical protein